MSSMTDTTVRARHDDSSSVAERGETPQSTSPRFPLSSKEVYLDGDAGSGREQTWRPTELNAQKIGRAIASRCARAARRGNLPFLVVFLIALFVFFGALAGVGYVDADVKSAAAAAKADSEFIVGGPVYDPSEGQRLRELQIADQRERELKWQRKQRPNAGAWMRKQRNDGAVRPRVAGADSAVTDGEVIPPPS